MYCHCLHSTDTILRLTDWRHKRYDTNVGDSESQCHCGEWGGQCFPNDGAFFERHAKDGQEQHGRKDVGWIAVQCGEQRSDGSGWESKRLCSSKSSCCCCCYCWECCAGMCRKGRMLCAVRDALCSFRCCCCKDMPMSVVVFVAVIGGGVDDPMGCSVLYWYESVECCTFVESEGETDQEQQQR